MERSDLKKIKEMLLPVFKENKVKKAVLFGSFSKRSQTRKSDLDLMIITDTDKRFFDRYEQFERIHEIVKDRTVDMLIYTAGELSSIPTVPFTTAGVMNHHGDALPVVRRAALLDVEESELPEPAHVLVIAPKPMGGAQIGMPVDRIVGLVDGAAASSPGPDPIVERRAIDGRVVFVLDPRPLVARAAEAIESSRQRLD